MCKTRLVSEISRCFFEEIQGDLGQVVRELGWEVCGGPRLWRGNHELVSQAMKGELLDEYPLRATLLLLSAKFGDYNLGKLKPAAVGVELLNLAVQKHYPRVGSRGQGPGTSSKLGTRNSKLGRTKQTTNNQQLIPNNEFRIANSDIRPPTSDNLALITGDYYYARAVSLGSTFDDPEVVKIMVQAISEIAQGEVGSQGSLNESTLKKLASLYSTSCHLGALIGGVSEKMTKALKKYGLNLGVAYRLVNGMHEKGEPQRFLVLAKKALVDLPTNKHRSHLKKLADSLV